MGLVPLRCRCSSRESLCLLAQHFGDALSLRRNHPHVIPEVCALAQLALAHCGLAPDVIVDEASSAYPSRRGADGPRADDRGVYARSCASSVAGSATARSSGRCSCTRACSSCGRAVALPAGAGRRPHRGRRRLEPQSSGPRCCDLRAHCARRPRRGLPADQSRACAREDGQTTLIEVDVSAHAPRMQRTLLELGFLPCAYIPAMVFSDVERLDIVRMVRLFVPRTSRPLTLSPRAQAVADVVLPLFQSRHVLPQIERAVTELPLFQGLDPEQVRRVASACRTATLRARRGHHPGRGRRPHPLRAARRHRRRCNGRARRGRSAPWAPASALARCRCSRESLTRPRPSPRSPRKRPPSRTPSSRPSCEFAAGHRPAGVPEPGRWPRPEARAHLSELGDAEIPHHTHVLVLEDVAVVEEAARVWRNSTRTETLTGSTSTVSVQPASLMPSRSSWTLGGRRIDDEHAKLPVQVNGVRHRHSHGVGLIDDLPDMRRARGHGFAATTSSMSKVRPSMSQFMRMNRERLVGARLRPAPPAESWVDSRSGRRKQSLQFRRPAGSSA